MLRRRSSDGRRGHVLALTALSLIVLLGMIALAIDIGLLAVARAQCQNAADAGAVAGCRKINGNADAAVNYGYDMVPAAAIRSALNNKILGKGLSGDANTDWDTDDPDVKAKVHPANHSYKTGQVEVQIGSYTYYFNDADPSQEGFKLQFPRSDSAEPYSAVKVTVSYSGNWSFARVLGAGGFATSASATAVHRPRDVVIIMDLSGSMRFQSLPAGPYSGARTFSMNPEAVFPKFGHYSDTAGAALQGTSSQNSGSGEYYDPCNISTKTNSGPPILEYFFQNDSSTKPGTGNKAFSRAPDSYATTPGGDNYLKKSNNTGTDYTQTVNQIFAGYATDLIDFETKGYDLFLGDGGFKGYVQGPGYWGKTFFIWPPDPRTADPSKSPNNSAHHSDNGAKDWRRRFFFKENVYASTNKLGWLNQNNVLWNASNSGYLHTPGHSSSYTTVNEDGINRTYTWKINYAAILKWLDTDPKPFASQLRAGRIKFYDAIPNYNDATLNSRWWTTATDSLSNLNERFWKGYIDFVIGVNWRSNGYSTTNNDDPTKGTRIQSMIGNGQTYDWGTRKISEKPQPTTAYENANARYDYFLGHNDWISLKNVNNKPSVGHYIKLGNEVVYVISGVQNWSSTSLRVEVKLNKPLEADFLTDTWSKAYKVFPYPYMNYDDNPRRPRHQFWFGPMTLVDYLGNYNTNNFSWPGNIPEAQNWACKVGIQSVIDDIRMNHPNDFVGLTFFSSPKYSNTGSGQHNQAVVPLGRNYTQLKDSLWFPPSTVVGGVTEITPWDPDFESVPRAKGGTCPGMGFMIAYNLFSSSTELRFYSEPQPAYRGVAGGLGRKGAARIIIFETDGAPNTQATANLTGSGKDSYYPIRLKNPQNLYDSKNKEWPSSGNYSDTDVFNVVKQITAMTTANPPGYSTTRKKVQVYSIAFGTLFDPANSSDPDQTSALDFLQTVQYHGNTAKTTNGSDFPDFQRVYGTHDQRVARIQQAFTAIMQGGVQVSLIE